jgi:homoserine dehydrogenase
MATLDSAQLNQERATRVLDSFTQFDTVVNANEFDIVSAFFADLCDNEISAKNFTTFLFRISNTTQIPVLELLDQLRGTSKIQVNATLAYYLNSMKSKTTLYGVSNLPKPNQTVQRNIIL